MNFLRVTASIFYSYLANASISYLLLFLARNGLGFALFLGKRSQLFVFLGAMSELHEKQAEKVQIFLVLNQLSKH